MAIVNILPYRKSLYDLPVPKYKNSNFPDFPNMKVDEAKIGIGKIGKIGKMIESVLKVQKYVCKIWPEIPNLGYEGRKYFSDPAK